MAYVDFINKGIPVELPRYVQINIDVLYQNSLDRDKLDKYLSLHTANKANIDYVFKCIKEKLFDRFLLNHE